MVADEPQLTSLLRLEQRLPVVRARRRQSVAHRRTGSAERRVREALRQGQLLPGGPQSPEAPVDDDGLGRVTEGGGQAGTDQSEAGEGEQLAAVRRGREVRLGVGHGRTLVIPGGVSLNGR